MSGSGNTRKPVLKRRTTIFDGEEVEKRRKRIPYKTYKSKNYSIDKRGQREVYLPQVAVAVKMHLNTKEILKK